MAQGETCFIAASVYGKWDYLPNEQIYALSTVHRILSDLTPLLVGPGKRQHATPVLVAGDLNATTQVAAGNQWRCEGEEADVLFGRFRALGLRDVIAHTARSRPRLDPCSCPEATTCSHARTYRNANRADSRPTQLDYVFVSDALLPTVTACTVHDVEGAWQLSDHCPVVVDLSERA